MDNTISLTDEVGNEETKSIRRLIFDFLKARSEIFCQLEELRVEGWKNPKVDKHFEKQRRVADEAFQESSDRTRKGFFNLMQRIGDEIQEATGVLSLPKSETEVLDICMAPGGYSASALKYSPHAHVSGITLPNTVGGHQLLIGRKNPRVEILFTDVTMLAAEYSITELPADHPDISQLTLKRPWPTKSFDLVFCDGQVLRTHQPYRASYREPSEPTRLTCSQLILAMQRIKSGGSFIMLLHKVDEWRTMKLLNVFDKISHLELFKPLAGHQKRSSFYLIAKNVQPRHPEAISAVNEWKAAWKNATFPEFTNKEIADPDNFSEERVRPEEVSEFLASFGERLINLGEPIWRIQKDALKSLLHIQKAESSGEARQEPEAAVQAGSESLGPESAIGASRMMESLRLSD